MITILFWATVVLEVIYTVLFVLTIKVPGFRFWPPPSARSWQFFLAWFIAAVVAVNFLILGLVDFESAFLPYIWVSLPFALALFISGSAIGFWAATTFGFRATLGLGGRLVTDGPYRYTRNPQYIGDCLLALGYMILANSWMVWTVGALGILLNLLAPFTEEPWLEERFGESYLDFKRRVPRFIPLRRKIDAAGRFPGARL
jgi:protein-S-isoprenylcysteine O-methyltransferase Ste14